MDKQTCAFTGHRPSKLPWRYDESDSRCIALKRVLFQQIRRLAEEGITCFLSGMALGTDIWCAEAVLALKKENSALELHCVLPCEGQEIKWPAPAQERYHSILKQADHITYVSREYHKDCMLERNRWMVDHADWLLAVYNGEYRGGTAATVRYAQKRMRRITMIHPLTGQVVTGG